MPMHKIPDFFFAYGQRRAYEYDAARLYGKAQSFPLAFDYAKLHTDIIAQFF